MNNTHLENLELGMNNPLQQLNSMELNYNTFANITKCKVKGIEKMEDVIHAIGEEQALFISNFLQMHNDFSVVVNADLSVNDGRDIKSTSCTINLINSLTEPFDEKKLGLLFEKFSFLHPFVDAAEFSSTGTHYTIRLHITFSLQNIKNWSFTDTEVRPFYNWWYFICDQFATVVRTINSENQDIVLRLGRNKKIGL